MEVKTAIQWSYWKRISEEYGLDCFSIQDEPEVAPEQKPEIPGMPEDIYDFEDYE